MLHAVEASEFFLQLALILVGARLFGAAELRLGSGDRQQTVGIVRTDGRPQS